MSLLAHPKATILSTFRGSYGELDKTRSFPLRSNSKVSYPSKGQPNGLFSKPSKGAMGKKAQEDLQYSPISEAFIRFMVTFVDPLLKLMSRGSTEWVSRVNDTILGKAIGSKVEIIFPFSPFNFSNWVAHC